MADEAVAPPNIWRFEECAAVNTDGVNMKEYKPCGQFYTDSNNLCNLYGIKAHPIFREPVLSTNDDKPLDDGAVGGFEEQKRAKEPTTISVSRYRLDPNTMKALFKVLEGCQHIQTLK